MIDISSAPEKGQIFVWDDELVGFGVRITPGSKSFVAESRINGVKRRVTLGRYPTLLVEEAKKKARQALAEMANGIDPVEGKRQSKKLAITLREVLNVYLATKELRPSTIYVYRRIISNVFTDWLDKPITSITKDQVEERHRELTSTPRRQGHSGRAYANGAFKTLQALINFANEKYEVDGQPLLAVNPVSRLTKIRAWYRVHPRTGVVPEHKLQAWYKAVYALPNTNVRDYFLLLMFSGLRRREGTNLKWTEVDLELKTLTIRRYQAKNHREHTLPLSTFLFELLQRRHEHRSTSEYVFPGKFDRGHLTDFKSGLREVRQKSGCRFLIHDLRRSFLTCAERLELPHYVLKRLANHSYPLDTLTPYVVVSDERLREHMERISTHFLELMQEEKLDVG